MNHVIAKIRTRDKNNNFMKLISGVTLFQLPQELDSFISYSPYHSLDEDGWFGITEFSMKSFSLSLINSDFSSVKYGMLKAECFEKLDFLCSIQNNNEFYFQKISKIQILRKKKIVFGDSVRYEDDSKEIVIKEEPDAVYIKNKDTLYFKKLSAITGIFKGIESLYREATALETRNFLQNAFIQLDNDFSEEQVKLANRKRIAMAIDIIEKSSEQKKKIIFDSIKEYCPKLVTEKDKFIVSSENDLKLLLYGIDQRFYTTPDGEEKRIANSVIRLVSGM